MRIATAHTARDYRVSRPGVVLESQSGVAVIGSELYTGFGRIYVRIVRHDPSGRFGPITGFEVEEEEVVGGWGTVERIRHLAAAFDERGPVPWRAEWVSELCELSGMDTPTAAMLLTGMHYVQTSETDFVPSAVRELLGLQEAQALQARDDLRKVPAQIRAAFLDAAMPADPVALWDRGPDLAARASFQAIST